MGKYLEWKEFRGKYSKSRHTTCIFRNIFVQDEGWRSDESTRFTPMWPGFEYLRLRHSSFGFMFSPERIFPNSNSLGISNQERVCRGCTTTKSVCLLVYLFNPYFLPSCPSFHPYVRSTFVPPSTYLLRGYSMLPWIVGAFHSPKICLKLGKFHVTLVERYRAFDSRQIQHESQNKTKISWKTADSLISSL